MAGSSSWRLETRDGQLCELVLFVRDAVGLEVVGAEEVPSLVGPVPLLTDVLDPGARRVAAEQWRRWWTQILALQFGDDRDDRDGQNIRGEAHARARRRIAQHQAICDPPRFTALADRPALQAAARASFPAFTRWESARPSTARDDLSGSPLDWLLIKQTAEDVAFDRQVDIGEVQARVAFLPVDGRWWRRVAPGCVLCSIAAAADPATAQVLLRDAFDSHVTRSR